MDKANIKSHITLIRNILFLLLPGLIAPPPIKKKQPNLVATLFTCLQESNNKNVPTPCLNITLLRNCYHKKKKDSL